MLGTTNPKRERLMAKRRRRPHSTLADLLDDAVVPEGATDEVSHCWGSQAGPWYRSLKMSSRRERRLLSPASLFVFRGNRLCSRRHIWHQAFHTPRTP